MPLDAMYLTHIAAELRDKLTGSKVDRIFQPAKDQVILNLHGREGTVRLLMSANPSSPRVHISTAPAENPASPPMFCMLLRKQLAGGRLLEITQPPMERVLDFSFGCIDEFGEEVTRHLIIEIMGRNSNLVLLGGDGRIADCVRRVDYEMSQQRQVLPGLYYHLPPAQDRRNPMTVTLEELSGMLEAVSTPTRPDEFLLSGFSGLSPLICRELVCRYSPDLEDIHALSLAERYGFAAYLLQAFRKFSDGAGAPYLLCKNGKPWDYTFLPILQYGPLVESQKQESYSALLDLFYAGRDAAARMKSKSQATTRTVTVLRHRAARKLEHQKQELAATADRDTLRICGELITANLYRMERGQSKLVTENYYDPDGREIEIALSPRLTPQQNAAKYFRDYNKAKRAESFLTEQIEKGETELQYLESILEELGRAETQRDIDEIRQELMNGGYLKNTDRKKKMKVQPSRPMEFASSAGLPIRVGRNNMQNDQLTLKRSFKSDFWFHTQKIHGSHVILSCSGTKPDEVSIRQAAQLAAYYSQAREGQNVPVDYTMEKNVKKPTGAKPGMVIYDHYNTIYVSPDPNPAKEQKS